MKCDISKLLGQDDEDEQHDDDDTHSVPDTEQSNSSDDRPTIRPAKRKQLIRRAGGSVIQSSDA